MVTTIETGTINGGYIASNGNTVIFTDTAVVTNGISLSQSGGIFSENVAIVVDGTVASDYAGVHLYSNTGADGNNSVQVGTNGSLYGTIGIWMSGTTTGNFASLDGQIVSTSNGIKSESADSTITVGSTGTINAGGAGILSTAAAANITVAGSITAALAGIKVQGGDGSSVANSGYVIGVFNGIYALDLADFTLSNTGTFSGDTGIRLKSVTGAASVLNDGLVTGTTYTGIFVEDTDANITNTGTISGETYGIYATSTLSNSMTLTNTGVISSAGNSIRVVGGSFDIVNSGEMNGSVTGGSFADSLTNSGVINGDVVLGSGTDTYTGVGSGQVNGFVDGEGGNDTLWGADNRDDLRGGGNNDRVRGFGGDDILDGGAGADTVGGGDGDDEVSGGAGNDQLWGAAGDDTLSGGDSKDKLRGGDGDDELSGGKANDELSGGRGNDLIKGDAGVDTLDGGIGNDTLTGGGGRDEFVFRADGDRDVITDFQDDFDTLQLDQTIWGGGLAIGDVINTYATVIGLDTVFDFGNGDVLVVEGITAAGLLANDITLI